MVGLLLVVFVREHEALRVQGAETVPVRTGLGGVAGNKGGIAMRLSCAGFPILLVNLHLPSGQGAESEHAVVDEEWRKRQGWKSGERRERAVWSWFWWRWVVLSRS